MVPGRMAQSGTKDQGEIALERQPVEQDILLLVRKCFSKCSDLLVFLGGNMISRVKIILLFGIFIFLQFMFTGMTIEGGSALSLLLMIVMDCAVLYYLIKKPGEESRS